MLDSLDAAAKTYLNDRRGVWMLTPVYDVLGELFSVDTVLNTWAFAQPDGECQFGRGVLFFLSWDTNPSTTVVHRRSKWSDKNATLLSPPVPIWHRCLSLLQDLHRISHRPFAAIGASSSGKAEINEKVAARTRSSLEKGIIVRVNLGRNQIQGQLAFSPPCLAVR